MRSDEERTCRHPNCCQSEPCRWLTTASLCNRAFEAGREVGFHEGECADGIALEQEIAACKARLARMEAAAKQARLVCERDDDLSGEEILGEISELLGAALADPSEARK